MRQDPAQQGPSACRLVAEARRKNPATAAARGRPRL